MNIKSGLVFLIVLVAGVLGGTVAYQVATPTSSSAEPTANGAIVVPKEKPRGKTRGFAPCKRPATLEAGKCVTDVTRTVVLPGAVAPAQSGSSGRGPAPAPVPFQASGHHDEGRHHGGEGEEGHHGDDDDDDDDDRDDDREATDDPTDTHTDMDTDSDDVTDTHGDDDGGTHTRTRTHD